jgi:hypothetical protein
VAIKNPRGCRGEYVNQAEVQKVNGATTAVIGAVESVPIAINRARFAEECLGR